MVLYSTGCPKCNILEKRLTKNNFDFQISDDVEFLIEKGFQNAPVLEVNNKFYTYEQAMELLKEHEKSKGAIR